MRTFFLLAILHFAIISCNNDNTSKDVQDDTSKAQGETSQMQAPPDPIVKDSLPKADAIAWIKNYKDNPYRLQMVKLDGDKLMRLINASDSVRLWMAVNPANKVTMILQQKRKSSSDRPFIYYDLQSLSKETSTSSAETFLCPEPPNCDVFIEL